MSLPLPVSHPIVDQQGRLTQVWQKWLTSELDQSSSNSVMLAALSAPVMSGSVGKELTGIGGAVSGLTPSGDSLGIAEKPRWVAEWQAIQAEYPLVSSEPLAVHSTYLAAYAALQDYLDTLPTWSDLSTATAITRTTWDGKWADYYAARSALFTRLERQALDDAAAAGDAAATAQTAANSAQTTANNAATAAADAQAAANSANTALADIAADNKLTPIEKHQARQEWDVIAAEKVVNDTQATTFGITTEKTAYGTAFQTLATYLNAGTTWSSGTPSWLADANLSTTTTIDGATFRAKWKAYYDARTALLNAIAAKAKALADAAQTDVTNILTGTTLFGGENLVFNGNMEKSTGSRPKGWVLYNNGSDAGTTLTSGTGGIFGDATALVTFNTATGTMGIRCALGIDAMGGVQGLWKVNTTYVVTGVVRGSGSAIGKRLTLAWNTPPANTTWITNPAISSNWQRFVVRITLGATTESNGSVCISLTGLPLAAAGTVEFDGIQVEEGSVPTVWKPCARELIADAATAQTAANAANSALADIAADDKLTPIEKHQARQEWDVIAAEKVVNDTQATTFGITTEKTAYGTAFQALADYLNAGTAWSSGTPSWLADVNLSTTTTIDGATFRAKWKAYYDARTALLNAIAAKAKALADAAQGSANNAQTAANSAQTTANNAATAAANAQTSANAANSALADIAADNKLTPIEKHQARQEWDVIAAEKVVNDTQATTFGITTEKTAYGTAFQALADYLNAGTTWSSGTPSWLADVNLSTTTTIDGATFRAKWKAYYDARTALLNAIAAKAKALADAAQTDVTNILTGTTLFGGENLVFNGNMEKSTGSRPKGWVLYNNGSDAGTTLTSGTGGIFGDATALVTFNTATGTMGIRCWLDIAMGGVQGLWKVNTTYVVTGVVRGSGSAIGKGLLLAWNTPPANTTWITNPAISSNWQRFVVRITLGAKAEANGNVFISLTGLPLAAAGTVEFDGIQVEEGSVPTVWKPCARELIADAATAQTAANAANSALADIAADDKLTPIEKHQARQEWDVIAAEKVVNDTQATTFGITTEKTAYGTAFQTLATYLNAGTTWSSGTPSWLADANLSTTTTIDGATFRAKWKAYYDARTALLNAIAAKAKALADAAQGSANTAQTAANSAQTTADNAASAAAYADRLARSGNNLIKNGNSEDPNPTGYEAAGVYDTTNDSYKAFTGSKVRLTVTNDAGAGSAYVTGEIPCAPGEQHTVEAMVLNINAVGSASVGIRYMGPSGITGLGTQGVVATANSWVRVNAYGTAPDGTTSVSFYIEHMDAGGAQARAYYDCLYATRKVSAPMLETDILKSLLVLGEVIETPNYVPGSAGVPPVGARVAGAPWTITLLDGTTIQGNMELGEGASIAGHPALSYANMLLYRKVEFASPGAWSWTAPAGVRRARITVCGAGGGGKGGSSSGGGLGGRNGAALVLELTNLTQGQVISGANGAAGAAGNAGCYGGDGGASTLTVADKMWTINGGAGGGNTTTSCSTLTGGYGTTCTASERKTDLLDGSLLGGVNIQSLRYATGAGGALNAGGALPSVGGSGSWLAPGGKGGDGGTLVIPNGQAGAAGTKGSGGGGGGGAASGGTGGIGGAGSPGYALIEY